MTAFLDAKAAGLFSRNHIANNVVAGVVVGVVALPLAMAFVIASVHGPNRASTPPLERVLAMCYTASNGYG
jgi:SulP family sulfate permease